MRTWPITPGGPRQPATAIAAGIYYHQATHTVTTRLALTGGATHTAVFTVPARRYPRAQALADWTADTAGPRPARSATRLRLTRFRQAALTTVTGRHGTIHGPWALQPVEATTTGRRPPAGRLAAVPGYLWNDHHGRGWGDAFGVWLTAKPAPAPSHAAADWISVSLASGADTCAIRPDRSLWCWGGNTLGAVATGTVGGNVDSPFHVQPDTTWLAVYKGRSGFCGIQTGGGLYCWGDNYWGTIGNGKTGGVVSLPYQVEPGTTWMDASGGWVHTCAIRAGGALYCWGTNNFGQIGNGTIGGVVTTPHNVDPGTTWTSISAGLFHTCGIQAGGALYCWGNNYFGQIGIGSAGGAAGSPQQVEPGTVWASVSAGGTHTCATRRDGALNCWGANNYGQIGNGTTGGNIGTPYHVQPGTTWTSVSVAGGNGNAGDLSFSEPQHTCGIRSGGTLYCWGADDYGQIGNGTTGGNVGTPYRVQPGTTWEMISTGGTNSCGIRAGSLYCWGRNNHGEIGNGTVGGFAGTPERVTP